MLNKGEEDVAAFPALKGGLICDVEMRKRSVKRGGGAMIQCERKSLAMLTAGPVSCFRRERYLLPPHPWGGSLHPPFIPCY